MSAIGGAGDRGDEQLRKARELASRRETEQAKQQAQRIKGLHESHATELAQSEKNHEKQLDILKERSREQLTSRDMRYQKEMDDLRDLHAKQLQRQRSEAESVLTETQRSLKNENERVRETTDQQKEILQKTYGKEMRAKEAQFEKFADESRDQQEGASTLLKKRLAAAHTKELDSLIKDRDHRIGELQKRVENANSASEEKYAHLETQKRTTEDRLLHDSRVALEQERETNRLMQNEAREDVKANIEQIKNRFEKAAAANRRASEDARDGLQGSVVGRLNKKISALEDDKSRLENSEPRTKVANDRQKNRELQHLRDSMQENIENLEDIRKETLASANEKTQQEIKKMQRMNTEAVGGRDRFYQDKIALDNGRNAERLDQLELNSQRLLNQEKTTSQTRFEKLKGSSEMEQGKLRAYFERATASMKDNFEETLREMRERNQKEKQQLFSSFAKRSQENDTKFQQQLSDVQIKYERQIAEIQEDHLKELKDQQAMAERMRKDVTKKSDLELKTQASQFEYRLAKIEDSHSKQIEDLKRKHDESLANLTKTRQA